MTIDGEVIPGETVDGSSATGSRPQPRPEDGGEPPAITGRVI